MDKTVPEWCKARHLSRSTYHKLKNLGRGLKELEGHQTIRAEVYDSLSDDEAELVQIDENLIRANLSDAERILHVARRKQLYEGFGSGGGAGHRGAIARSSTSGSMRLAMSRARTCSTVS